MTGRRLAGRRVISGNSQIHLLTAGTDTAAPTVVLEAGLAGCSTSWTHVINLLAPHTRVVAYDRAGHGRSTNPHTRTPRTPAQVAEHLHAALSAADIPGPYLLVGHSAGAIYSHAFAARFAQHAVGLVLVDPSLPSHPAATTAPVRWMLPLVEPVMCAAITRVTGHRSRIPRLPVTDRRRPHGTRSEWTQAKTWQAMLQELRGLARADPPSIPMRADLPIVVITQAPPRTSDGAAVTAWRRLAAVHRTLAGTTPHSQHRYAAHAGHAIPTQEPHLIAEAVLHLIHHAPLLNDVSRAKRSASGRLRS